MAEDRTEQEQKDHNKARIMFPIRSRPRGAIDRLGDVTSDWRAWIDPVFKDMSFDVISAQFDELKATWKASPSYEVCYNAIEETVFKQKNL